MDSALAQWEEKESSTPDEEREALQQVVYNTSIYHEDNLDGQSDKQGNTRMDRAAIYGRSSDQIESLVDWTPPEDVTRQATKTGSLLSTVFRS